MLKLSFIPRNINSNWKFPIFPAFLICINRTSEWYNISITIDSTARYFLVKPASGSWTTLGPPVRRPSATSENQLGPTNRGRFVVMVSCCGGVDRSDLRHFFRAGSWTARSGGASSQTRVGVDDRRMESGFVFGAPVYESRVGSRFPFEFSYS